MALRRLLVLGAAGLGLVGCRSWVSWRERPPTPDEPTWYCQIVHCYPSKEVCEQQRAGSGRMREAPEARPAESSLLKEMATASCQQQTEAVCFSFLDNDGSRALKKPDGRPMVASTDEGTNAWRYACMRERDACLRLRARKIQDRLKADLVSKAGREAARASSPQPVDDISECQRW